MCVFSVFLLKESPPFTYRKKKIPPPPFFCLKSYVILKEPRLASHISYKGKLHLPPQTIVQFAMSPQTSKICNVPY
jgi:hypothetical protein